MRFLLCGGVALLAVLGPGPVAAQTMTSRTVPVRHADPQDLLGAVQVLLSPGGSVLASGHALVVQDTPATLNQASRLIASLDVSAPHVRLEVHLGPPGPAPVVAPPPSNLPEAHGSQASIVVQSGSGGPVNDLHVEVLDGATSWLQLGDSTTDVGWFNTYCHDHRLGPAGIEFDSVSTGVLLSPRVAGSEIALTVTPYIRYHAGSIDGVVAFRTVRTQMHLAAEPKTLLGTPADDELYRHIFGSLASDGSFMQASGEVEAPTP
jgi:hypothetical protein